MLRSSPAACLPTAPDPVRVLGPADLSAAVALAEADPVVNVFVLARLHAARGAWGCDGAELWGHEIDGGLRALCWSGANIVPVGADEAAAAAFARHALLRPRRCSSLVGPAAAVRPLWRALESTWGPAREVRDRQPLLVIGPEQTLPALAPEVRPVHPAQFEVLLPAAVAMFAEEIGTDPLAGEGRRLFPRRLRELVEAGRSFAWIAGREVVFKAEIGAVSGRVCQVQGVWVNPSRRGQGLAVPAMAAVVELARRLIAPTVSLYVNDYNHAALATYRRVGFRPVDTFTSILL